LEANVLAALAEITGFDDPCIYYNTFSPVMRCYVDIRQDFYHHNVLSDGDTVFTGFDERMAYTLTDLASSTAWLASRRIRYWTVKRIR
jgi:actin-related protein